LVSLGAGLSGLVAHSSGSNVLIVAKQSQTLGQHNNRISLVVESHSFAASYSVEISGVLSVGNSRSSVSDHVDAVENVCVLDVDVGNHC